MRRTSLFVLALASSLAASARAQRLWLPAEPSRNVGFEIGKGFFRSGTSIDFASFIVTAQARIPVNDKVAVTAAIPLSRLSETSSFTGATTVTSTAIGNPWLGIEVAASPGLVVEAGIRPGVASDAKEDALLLGVLDDFDRFEAWLPKVTSMRAIAHIGTTPERGTFISGMLGGTFAIARDGGATEFYANYGLRAGFRGEGRLASLALTGRARLTHGGSLDERTVHHVTFMIEGTNGKFRPNASIGTYLDESARQDVKAIVTIGASIVF